MEAHTKLAVLDHNEKVGRKQETISRQKQNGSRSGYAAGFILVWSWPQICGLGNLECSQHS